MIDYMYRSDTDENSDHDTVPVIQSISHNTSNDGPPAGPYLQRMVLFELVLGFCG